MKALKIKPLSSAIGAIVEGVDLAQPLSAHMIEQIRQALLNHLVLFFRDQRLDPVSLKTAASMFGQPVTYPFVKGIAGVEEVIEVLKLPSEKVNFGGVWHADSMYQQAPAMGALLYAVELPPAGGDTLFSNQYLAYKALSSGLSHWLKHMNCINDSDKALIAETRAHRTDKVVGRNLRAVHPVIRTHPETGQKLVNVSRAHTTHFENWTPEESAGLLEYLFEIQCRPEFCCRFQWQPGSVAFWDNRACQHYPINDYDGYKRLMYRVSLAGDEPF